MMKYMSLICIILLAATMAFAAPPEGYVNTATPFDYDTDARIDVNNIEMVVTNVGSFSRWIVNNGNSGMWFPKGTDKTPVYAAGLWIGGRVAGEDRARVTVAEYSYEYTPGVIQGCSGGTIDFTDGTDLPEFKVYKINKGDTEASNPDYANWPFDQGAPYVDENGNGQHDSGEPPLIYGDQTLFAVYHDAQLSAHINDAGGPPPIGMEIQHTTFGFNRADPLGNVVFFMLKVVNKSCNTIEDTYMSLWSDPDVGGSGDDLVGCDPGLGLGFSYNATNSDLVYGGTPPAVGYDFFQGPIVPSEGDTARVLVGTEFVEFPGMRVLGMSSFNKYTNGTDPHSPEETYFYMQGLSPDGDPVINEVTGEVTTYMNDGDPVAGSGWLDTNAADRRLMLSSGPFTMPPWEDVDGDGEADMGEPGVQEIVAAIVVGQGGDRLSSVSVMKYYDQFAQEAFDKAFVVEPPPPNPVVTANAGNGQVILYWGDDSEVTQGNFEFEGYNVYQFARIGDNSPRKIATYDLNNGVATIIQKGVDPATGALVDQVVQKGGDTGIRRSIIIEQDNVRGVDIYNGSTYYFAVTAYSYNPDPEATVKSLESALNLITVRPEAPNAGDEIPETYGNVLEVDHPTGSSDGICAPTVVDPSALTGDNYRVTFETITNADVCGTDDEGEALSCLVWHLTNTTSGDRLLENMTLQDPNRDDYPIVDGFMMKMSGPPVAFNTGEFRQVATADGPTPIDADPNGMWHSLGPANEWGRYFISAGGGAGTVDRLERYIDYAVPRDFEIRFLDATYSEDGWTGETGWGLYAFTSNMIRRVPFEIWDIGVATPDDPSDDKRMIPFILPNGDDLPWRMGTNPTDAYFSGYPESDWIYWMDADEAAGGYQAFHDWCEARGEGFVDETYETDAFVNYYDGFVYPIGRFVICDYSLTEPYNTTALPGGTVIRLVTNKPNASSDVFEFTAPAPTVNSAELGKEMLKEIKTVPNPYFAKSTYELNQFDRKLQFTHLPEKCTIRIFNLAGDLVRTIEKDDASSIYEWDLKNSSEIPVASGLYIWYLESDYGDTYGKMAIIMEEERVDEY